MSMRQKIAEILAADRRGSPDWQSWLPTVDKICDALLEPTKGMQRGYYDSLLWGQDESKYDEICDEADARFSAMIQAIKDGA